MEIHQTFCPDCGIYFGLDSKFEEAKRQSGTNFCCPNGHKLHFNKVQDPRDEQIKKLQIVLIEETERRKRAERDVEVMSEQLRTLEKQLLKS